MLKWIGSIRTVWIPIASASNNQSLLILHSLLLLQAARNSDFWVQHSRETESILPRALISAASTTYTTARNSGSKGNPLRSDIAKKKKWWRERQLRPEGWSEIDATTTNRGIEMYVDSNKGAGCEKQVETRNSKTFGKRIDKKFGVALNLF